MDARGPGRHRPRAGHQRIRLDDADDRVMPRLDDPLDLVGARHRLLARPRGQGVHAGFAIRVHGHVRHGRYLAIARGARALVIEIGRRIAGHG